MKNFIVFLGVFFCIQKSFGKVSGSHVALNSVGVGQHFFSTWVLEKKCISLSRKIHSKWWFELEYAWGESRPPDYAVVEKYETKNFRFSMNHYPREKSFRFHYGMIYEHLNSELMSDDQFQVSLKNVAISFGLGHRWAMGERFFLSVDWIQWHYPLIYVSVQDQDVLKIEDPQERENVKEWLSAIRNSPRLTFFAIKLGYFF